MPGKSRAQQASEAAAEAEGRETQSQYLPIFATRAHEYCLLGATNDELAQFLKVDVSTIQRWLVERQPFARAVARGREVADAKVARSLYRRATGMRVRETKVQLHNGEWKSKDISKAYPPDVGAAALWLANRQPSKWRSKDAGSGAPSLDLEAVLDEIERRREKRTPSLPGDRAKAIEAQDVVLTPPDNTPSEGE